MDFNILSVLTLGFLLGIKHAIEPDHVIAVSTVASRSKKVWNSILTGVFWGIGHTLTLFVIGFIIIGLKSEIPDVWAMSLEFLVGIMLVYFGISALSTKLQVLAEKHEHTRYGRSLLMGFIHGLAGSAAMVLLTVSTVDNMGTALIYILIFGMGTIVGMLSFTTLLGLPFIFRKSEGKSQLYFAQFTGVLSILFGFYYMYNLGVTEGLFSMWMQ